MALANKRVLITGGAGFVGSHIADLLVDEGCRDIVCIDNLVRGREENLASAMARGPIRLVKGDIRHRELLDALVAESDVVFHQAALRITQCAAEPRHALEVMVDATFDLLEACVRHNIDKVIVASTASVYGMADRFPTDETVHPYNNRTLYGAAKVFNEGLLRSYNDMFGLNYVAFRYFNVYGPRMDIHGKYTEVLIRWMERIENGQSPLIFGDGLQTMDFVHVRDIARANVIAAKADVSDRVFNVGSGTETSLAQLATTLTEVMAHPQLELEYVAERNVNPVPRRLASVEAARRLLGFETTISLEDGLRELVDWWRQQKVPASSELASVSAL